MKCCTICSYLLCREEFQREPGFDGVFGHCLLIGSKISIATDVENQIECDSALKFLVLNQLLEQKYLKTKKCVRLFRDDSDPCLYKDIESNSVKWMCVNISHLDTGRLDRIPDILDLGLLNCYYSSRMHPISVKYPDAQSLCDQLFARNEESLPMRIGSYETFGYIRYQSDDPSVLHFTEKAWDRVRELLEGKHSSTCFVAMPINEKCAR